MKHRNDAVTLLGVHKRFGDKVVLADFDLAIPYQSVVAMTGPNGSGKTTVGRIILGLESPDAGSVGGSANRTKACVFQENRLFSHLSAVENVTLVLGRDHAFRATRELHTIGLSGSAQTVPVRDLSGGQRRRVALVRALAGDAQLIVLDEPFIGIDAQAKPAVMTYVRKRLEGRTALLITHDGTEADALGARLVQIASRNHIDPSS